MLIAASSLDDVARFGPLRNNPHRPVRRARATRHTWSHRFAIRSQTPPHHPTNVSRPHTDTVSHPRARPWPPRRKSARLHAHRGMTGRISSRDPRHERAVNATRDPRHVRSFL